MAGQTVIPTGQRLPCEIACFHGNLTGKHGCECKLKEGNSQHISVGFLSDSPKEMQTVIS